MSQIEELEAKVGELEQKVHKSLLPWQHTTTPTQNSELVTQNEEIPLLRDSLEESKYLESKVVSWRERERKGEEEELHVYHYFC